MCANCVGLAALFGRLIATTSWRGVTAVHGMTRRICAQRAGSAIADELGVRSNETLRGSGDDVEP